MAPTRVQVEPALLTWARRRAGIDRDELIRRFPKLEDWEEENVRPTLKQLERFAQATNVPFGTLFLDSPPDEPLPIPDFRTIGDRSVGPPSGDLLDTLVICEQRQDWYRDHVQKDRGNPLPFVGSVTTEENPVEVARLIRSKLDLREQMAADYKTWDSFRTALIERVEHLEILVMVSGIVGSNTHRQLDPEEFRGLTLVDEWAPVIFVNGADTKAAQIFTLAHELGHVWLGRSALDDPAQALAAAAQDASNTSRTPTHDSAIVESWCNEVAAEVLVPIAEIREELEEVASVTEEILNVLARRYKVSGLVILRRLFDIEKLGRHSYWEWFDHVLERAASQTRQSPSGGNFYNTHPFRTSRRFAKAVLEDAFEGGTTYREAAQLLGFRSLGTLDRLADHLGVQ